MTSPLYMHATAGGNEICRKEQDATGEHGLKKRPHRKDRESALKALPCYANSNASYLGSYSNLVPLQHVCRLRWQEVPGAPGVPSEIVLDRSPLLVGRNNRSGADILLNDPKERGLLSQLHAVFRLVSPADRTAESALPGEQPTSGWEIFDLDSLNGTVVDGIRAKHAFLKPGSQIVFGAGANVAVGQRWSERPSRLCFMLMGAVDNRQVDGDNKHSVQLSTGKRPFQSSANTDARLNPDSKRTRLSPISADAGLAWKSIPSSRQRLQAQAKAAAPRENEYCPCPDPGRLSKEVQQVRQFSRQRDHEEARARRCAGPQGGVVETFGEELLCPICQVGGHHKVRRRNRERQREAEVEISGAQDSRWPRGRQRLFLFRSGSKHP